MHITHMIHATENTSNMLPMLWKKLTVCEIVLALHEWERAHVVISITTLTVNAFQNVRMMPKNISDHVIID